MAKQNNQNYQINKKGNSMSRKASFSVEISAKHSTAHNDRTEPPKYLLGLEKNTQNYYNKLNGYESDSQFVKLMSQKYQSAFGQKMQQKQKDSMVKEAIISLEKYHDEKDVLSLFQELGEIFGGHIPLELSIHKDEGHYISDGISYYPSKHIVKKESGWYTISDDPNYNYDDEETHSPSTFFDNPIDISEFTPVYNYHAHVKFTMINMMGIVPSFEKDADMQVISNPTEQDKLRTAKMTKKMMQSRLKIVAGQLSMRYEPNPKTSRIKKSIAHAKEDRESKREIEIANANHKKEIEALETRRKTVSGIYQSGLTKMIKSLKEKHKITQDDIDQIRKSYRRQMIDSEEFYTQEDYMELKSLFNGLKNELKDKKLTIKSLEHKISTLDNENDSLDNHISKTKAIIEEKDRYITKLKEQLNSASSDSASANSELRKIRPKIDNLQKKINKQTKDIKTLKDLSFIKDEDGEFETYKADDGKSYYKTYKQENEKLEDWKDKAITFFKKVSSFFGFSSNLADANLEIDEMIQNEDDANEHIMLDDFSGGAWLHNKILDGFFISHLSK